MKRLKPKNWMKWLDALGLSMVTDYQLEVNHLHQPSLTDYATSAGFKKGDFVQIRHVTVDHSYIVAPGGQPLLMTVQVQFRVGDKIVDVKSALDSEIMGKLKNG